MSNNIVNLFAKVFTPNGVQKTTAVKAVSTNPFGNPFVTPINSSMETYAKNNPVHGGYFAGYHNGQPNIVGRRLFVEV